MPQENRSKSRARLRSFLLLGGTVTGMLVLAEGAIRLFMPQYLRPVMRERVEGAHYTRADLHARIASPGEFDTEANTTSQRFRATRLYSTGPTPGTLRIAVIGDSYVFGTGAEDSETYPSILEARMAQLNEVRVEVLNAGIHGSGISDQVIWFDRWVRQFRPNLVVLTVYGGNDLCDEIHDSKFVLGRDGRAIPLDLLALEEAHPLEARIQWLVRRLPGYHYLTQHSQLLYAVRVAVSSLLSRRNTAVAGDCSGGDLKGAAAHALDKIVAEVRWLRSKVEADGADLAIVLIPSRAAVSRGSADQTDLERTLREGLMQEIRRDGIPILDLHPIITTETPDPTSLYFLRDDHMRPSGYRLVGEEVARFLRDWNDRGRDDLKRPVPEGP